MVWSNDSQDSTWTPYDACTGVVVAPLGNFQWFSYLLRPVRARAGPARLPHKTYTDMLGYWHNQNLQKSCTGVVCGRTESVRTLRSPHGLLMVCLRPLNPYGARKLIMHAFKLYGPRTSKENPYGAVQGPGVWCDWGLTWILRSFRITYSPVWLATLMSVHYEYLFTYT